MLRNLIWDMGGKLGTQIVSLVISLVLTRLLGPEEFGVMGIALVFVVVSSVFLDMGFSRALIQEPEVSAEQYSTVFYLNLLIGLILGALCFILAVPISEFYRHEGLERILQVLSFLFLFNSLSLVPGAILARRMNFRAISFTALTSAALSGISGVYMAYQGYGVWSLVVQQIMASVITVVMYFVISKWMPSFTIRWRSIGPLWSYGSRLFSATLIGSLVARLDVFLIGRWYSTSILGFYSRAQSFETQFRNLSAGSLTSVFFPFIARLKDQKDVMLETYLRYLHIASFLSTGMAGILCLVAPDLFIVLFTDKWSATVGYFQLMMIAGFGWPISAIMVTLIAAVGNSKAFLRLEIIRFVVLLPVLFLGLPAGISTFLLIMIGVRIAFLIMNMFYVQKELNVSVGVQARIVSSYLATAIMAYLISAGTMYWIGSEAHLFRLIIMTLVYVASVFLLQKIFRTRAIAELGTLWTNGLRHLRKP